MSASSGRSDHSIWPAATGLAALIPGLAFAQVVMDGTTGPGGALAGPDDQITDDIGKPGAVR